MNVIVWNKKNMAEDDLRKNDGEFQKNVPTKKNHGFFENFQENHPHHPLNHSTSQIFPSFSGTPDLPQVATSPNLAE